MTPAIILGEPLDAAVWEDIKLSAIFDLHKWDIQSEDHCVLADFPIILSRASWCEISNSAEQMSTELLEAEEQLIVRDDLYGELNLPRPLQRALNQTRAYDNRSVRIMRFDFHPTDEGWKVSEVNCDVPGGYIESSDFTEMVAQHYSSTTAVPNIAQRYAEALIRASCPAATIGLVHATAYKDDREVMQFLSDKLRQRGCSTLMLAPEHVEWVNAAPYFKHQRLDAIVRFFPCEWLPNLHSESMWRHYISADTLLSNPATAALTQTKRLPLIWNRLNVSLCEWHRRLPETTAVDFERMEADEWVLKPAFGRVGEGIAICGVSNDKNVAAYRKAAAKRTQDWVLQKRFQALPTQGTEGDRFVCVGVYTIDGKAAGAYGRVSHKPLIDHEAQDSAVLIGAE